MAKKVWISFPLITTSDLKEESVVTFLKGGQKKDLEVEVAAFITKWLMDKDVPFGIDFDSCRVDRAVVIESLPKRLQKILGTTAPVVAEPVAADLGEVAPSEEAGPAEVTVVVEQVAEVVEAEAAETGEELPSGDGSMDEPSELR